MLLFAAPLAVTYFAKTFLPIRAPRAGIDWASFTSPFAVAFKLPIDLMLANAERTPPEWGFFAAFLAFYAVLNAGLFATMGRLFDARWRMS